MKYLSLGMVLLSCCVASPLVSATRENMGMQVGRDALATCIHMDERSNRDLTAALVCGSWVNGAVQGAAHTFSLEQQKPEYCTPKFGGSTGQYAAVFLKFLQDNPGKQHLPAIYLFHQAMAESFPCDYSKK